MKSKALTPEMIAKIPAHVKEWVDIGLSTEPADFDAAERGVLGCYAAAGLDRPKIILRMSSPYGAVLGVAIAATTGKFVRAQVHDQAHDQVYAQVGDQVHAQVYAQVRDQVDDQVHDQVYDQVYDQVGDQVGAQVGAQVYAQVGDQVHNQVHNQVGAQVRDQVYAQVHAQVYAQVSDQVSAQVHAQVRDQVGAQVGAQVDAQVRAQVRAQVYDQVGAQVYDQVRAQVRAQVSAQVHAQVRDQVGAQVGAQVDAQVRAQVRAQVDDQLRTVFNSYRGGNLWAGWYAYVTYLRDVYGFSGNKLSDFAHDELIARNAGWTIWGKDICAISDRPEILLRDDGGRLHSTVGPAIRWRDGYSLYAWHGVRIPPEWSKGEFPTAHEMLHWKNIEQRRAGCSMMGWAKILKEINAKIIDKDSNPMIGTLMEADIPDSGIERFLVVECGTGRKGIVLPVSREAKTAHEANASTWMFSDAKLYNPEVRT